MSMQQAYVCTHLDIDVSTFILNVLLIGASTYVHVCHIVDIPHETNRQARKDVKICI